MNLKSFVCSYNPRIVHCYCYVQSGATEESMRQEKAFDPIHLPQFDNKQRKCIRIR